MNTKEFRAAVNAKISAWAAANFPALPVVYENGPSEDEDTIGLIWLDTSIRWYGAEPVSVGSRSGRHSGALSMNVFYRQAQGTGAPDDIVDSLTGEFGSQRLGTAILKTPQRTVPTPELLGWYKTGVLVPFTLDA